MKQILLVGKFNDLLSKINKELSGSYAVQLCSDNLELLQGILEMNKPNMIIISVRGLDEGHKELFAFVSDKYAATPVLCVGSGEELALVHDFPGMVRMKTLITPAYVGSLIAAVNESLGVNGSEESREAGKGMSKWSKGQERKKILLVDDAAILLRTMQSMLKKDYDVKMATSGMMAIDLLRKDRPDLILLDYDMPECDGKETFERIQNEENGKDVPVVFVTGVNEKERIMAVLKLKPAGYLVKPVKRSDLLQIVKQTLEQ